MADRADILSRIRETHDVTEEGTTVSTKLPLGLLGMAETKWSVEGEGETGVHYRLEVAEYERRGRLASRFRSSPDTVARLLTLSPEPSAIYIAHMAVDGSTTFKGAVRPSAPSESSRLRDIEPMKIMPQEAELGFDASMQDARFAEA